MKKTMQALTILTLTMTAWVGVIVLIKFCGF